MSYNKFKVGDIVIDYELLGLSYSDGIVVIKGCGGADLDYFERVTTDNNSNLETTAMTTSRFTETTTKTTIKEVINGQTSSYANISIEPTGLTTIELVVGARYCHRDAASFGKGDLQELINELQAVHDVMESY